MDNTTSSLKTQVNGSLLFDVQGQIYNNLLDNEWHMYTLVINDNFAA
ncbi:MAG: hypothetical protein GXP45_01170 [bacterium]|nr:hypothetical protein [bacterium]